MYHHFRITGNDYIYSPGPAILIYFAVMIAAVIVPGVMLLRVSYRNPRSEAFMFGAGSVVSMVFVIFTNVFPGSFGLENMPRLGCISVGLFCGCAFYGIKRYGRAFSIAEIVAERDKLRLIGDSLESLVEFRNEDEVYSTISRCACDISDSACAVILMCSDRLSEYTVKAVTFDRLRSPELMNIFQKGNVLNAGKRSAFDSMMSRKNAIACESLSDLFPELIDVRKGHEINIQARIRQTLAYPVILSDTIQGVVLLLLHQPVSNRDLFNIFAVQSSLVINHFSQIYGLEEKRRLSEQLHQSRKMEAIGQLAGGIAHDFNNMLGGIIGYANLLKRKYGKQKEITSYSEVIVTASKRAAELTNRLLSFARKGTYQMRPFDIHGTVDEVARLLERTIDKRIRIWKNLSAEVHVVNGDQMQIQNALLNIALNARDAMPEGGDLIFETHIMENDASETAIRIHGLENGRYIVLSIIDSGHGMDEKTRSHLFEPFFTTKEVGKGTGLGLASVYGAIKDHDGFIEITSAQGKGTTVKIGLPLADCRVIPEILTEMPLVRGKGKILVVDDEEIVRNIARDTLVDLGYSVEVCNDGVEGIDYYRAHSAEIDLVVLDLLMPNKDGYQCFQELRQINPFVKVIIATGFNVRQEKDRSFENKITGLIRKPYDINTLSQAVDKALRTQVAV